MLQNAYFLAKLGADTAENDQHFAEILPKIGNYPTPPAPAELDPRPSEPRRGGLLRLHTSPASLGAPEMSDLLHENVAL